MEKVVENILGQNVTEKQDDYMRRTKQSWFQIVDKKTNRELDVLMAESSHQAVRKFINKGLPSLRNITVYPVRWK